MLDILQCLETIIDQNSWSLKETYLYRYVSILYEGLFPISSSWEIVKNDSLVMAHWVLSLQR